MIGKRLFDIAVACAALLIVGPIMILIVLVIWAQMRPPALYRQQRAGRGGRPFEILKFRTMRVGTTEGWDPTTDGERLTALGRFLRRWSLDELPQLLNVLRGDMSLVGPRPLPVEYLARYSPEQAARLTVLPGLTGWAQVNGRNSSSWSSRLAMDAWYVQHRSFALDLRILFFTVARVVRGSGIHHEGHATMMEFLGE